MKNRWIVLLSVFAFGGASAAEYIVKKSGNLKSVTSIQGVQVADTHSTGNLVKVVLPDTKSAHDTALAQLMKMPDVEYVVKNFQLRSFRRPVNPAALREQWGVVKVKAEEAWGIAGNRGSKNIVVAVIDTGVDYRHESLAPNMVNGYDFNGNDSDPMDETGFQNPGHGTHVAGVVGATGLVDNGIVGLSPQVSLMPLRFLGANGGGDLMDGIKSIDYAIEKGAHIIQASWGAAVPESQARPLIDAVKRADDAGLIFIAAAANDGKNNDTTDVYPVNAGTPNMIAVAASDPNDGKPSWSNYGIAKVHVSAPGQDIMSTLPQGKYGNLSGTSMATPLVSGLVALMLAQDPSLTGREARAILQQTGAKTAIQVACKCRVDAAAAVKAVVDKSPMVVPFAAAMAEGDTETFTLKNAQSAVKFAIADENIATVDGNGVVTAKAKGETTLTVSDDSGNSVQAFVRVGKQSSNDGGGGAPSDCPFGDAQTCQIICQIMPNQPFCQ